MTRILLALLALLWSVSAFAQGVGPLVVTQGPSATTPFVATGTTVARSPILRALDEINAVDLGLICDGATDNAGTFSRIQSRLALSVGKSVYFPPQTQPCLTSSAISAPSGTVYRASPGTVTIKPTSGSTASPLLFAFANFAQNVLVYGLTFDGNGPSFSNTNSVIQAYGGTNLVLDNVNIQNTRGIAVLFSTSVTNSGVRNSTFTNIGNGWTVSGLTADRQQAVAFCCGASANNSGNFVVDSYFSNIGLDAISATAQAVFTASRNRFSLNNGQITATWNNPQPTAFGAAIYGSGGNIQFTADSNTISGAQGNAIDVAAGNAVITSNYITDSGQAGIGFFTSGTPSSGTVTGNVIINSGKWSPSVFNSGISIYGAIGDLTIVGNTATDNQSTKTQQYGIQVVSGTTFTDLKIDPTNSLLGNATGSIGGVLSDFTQGATQENKVLNPCFAVDQRLAGGTYPAGGGIRLILDQWVAVQSNNGYTEARSAAVSLKGCGASSMLTTLTNSRTATGTDIYNTSQNIETASLQDLGYGTIYAKPLNMAFCAQSSVAGTYTASFRNLNGPATFLIPFSLVANTPQCFDFVIPGDSTRTFSTPGYGAVIGFDFGSGPNFQTASANTWVSGTYYSLSGQTNFLGQTNGATFNVSSVRLYTGQGHLPWAARPYGQELSLLQRYFSSSFADGVAPSQNAGAVGSITMVAPFAQVVFGTTGVWIPFPVRMRVAPTVTFYSTGAASANCYDATKSADAGAAAAVNIGVNGMFVQCTLATGDALGDTLQVHYAATAE